MGLLTVEELKQRCTLDAPVQPDAAAHEVYNRYYRMYHKLYGNLETQMREMAELHR